MINDIERYNFWHLELTLTQKPMEREIAFDLIFDQMCQTFQEIKYHNGDISDVGNEIGYALGKVLSNLTEAEIKDFIVGLKHGISLTNGTH